LGLDIVEAIYKTTKVFPEREYGLTSDMRRAAVSVPSNIAEGAARNSRKEFIHFLYISLGSLAELETQLTIAERLDYVSNGEDLSELIEKERRKLLNYIKYQKERT
jgi:four helix bundle protein